MLFINFLAVICLLISRSESRIVGGYYFGAFTGSPAISEINPYQLTHIFYAFVEVKANASISIQGNNISRIKNAVKNIPTLKKANPKLKILFSVVSINQSFLIVAADKQLRQTFAQNAVKLIKEYGYDGLDIDWEFPLEAEKENYILLLKDVKEALKVHNYLLTAAVRAIPSAGYDVPRMVKYLDLINIMTYDYYGKWSQHTGQNSPLYPSSKDSEYEKTNLNVAAGGKLWHKAGVPKEKLNIGLAFYGRTFTLTNASNHGVHDPITGAGEPVSPTYFQIRKNFSNYTEEWDDETQNPYKYFEDQWIGYDNERSIIAKVRHAVEQNYAGVFIWQLGGDDIRGEFGSKWKLLTAINENIKDSNKVPCN